MAHVGNIPVGPDNVTMTCPHCQSYITSNVTCEPTTKTHIIALLMCLFCCCLCVPCVYCGESCLAKRHTCPACHQFLGVYNG